VSPPTLRQFGDLVPQDLESSTVWVNCHVVDYDEPWYDDTDEETFRPWDGALPVDPSETMFIVCAKFELASGDSLPGFVTPQTPGDSDLGVMQPHLFTPAGRLAGFWLGMFGEPDAQLYRELRSVGEPVFPIRFSALPGLSTGLSSGGLDGFYRWSESGAVLIPPPS
jgi:hypothetical protein